MAIETLRPNDIGDEESINSSTSGPGNHWQDVNEEIADDDETYVANVKVASYQRDLYSLPASSGYGSINFIKIYIRISRSAGVLSYAKPSLKSNGTVTDGTEITMGSPAWDFPTFVTHSQQWNVNPADGQAWEWSDIDNLQIGVSLKAGSTVRTAYCTQVYIEINYTPRVDINIDAPSAILSSEALTPTLRRGVTISAPVATIDGEAVEPSMSLGVTLYPPLVLIDSEALEPEIMVGLWVTIEAPTALISSEALVPTLQRDAFILAPLALIDSEALVPTIIVIYPPSIMGRKTAYDGYRCFIEQYVKNKLQGTAPLKLPDGTIW